jgi:hypothetical protein
MSNIRLPSTGPVRPSCDVSGDQNGASVKLTWNMPTGWKELSAVAALPNAILRIFLFVLIGGALALTLIYQSRLPDRSLYKAVIVQTGALTLLFPFVVLEDLGLFASPRFPFLAGDVLIAATSLAATCTQEKA